MNSPKYKPGDVLRQTGRDGQRYQYVMEGERPHIRKDGQESRVVTWRGNCGVCGSPFLTTSGAEPRPHMRRSCPNPKCAARLSYTAPRSNRGGLR